MSENTNIRSVQGKIVWLYGRPCAGKTTIANQIAERLSSAGYQVITLDGDELRASINRDLTFSPEDRNENIRRSAEMAGILAKKGFIVVCSFVTPTNQLRNLVRQILREVPFDMIYISTSLNECKRRDTKGHYRMAQSGEINDFTGIGSPFEEPSGPDHVINTDELNVEVAVAKCLGFIVAEKF